MKQGGQEDGSKSTIMEANINVSQQKQAEDQ